MRTFVKRVVPRYSFDSRSHHPLRVKAAIPVAFQRPLHKSCLGVLFNLQPLTGCIAIARDSTRRRSWEGVIVVLGSVARRKNYISGAACRCDGRHVRSFAFAIITVREPGREKEGESVMGNYPQNRSMPN